MDSLQTLPIGRAGEQEVGLLLRYANRHGLIAGATGTGKTVTLQTLAEGFSARGVPVFMADVKGDLAGLSQPGGGNARVEARVQSLGLSDYRNRGYPVVFWDVFGEQGHPVRATVSEMGPLLLSRLMELNETQAGVLSLAFKLADDEGLLLLDLKDIRSLLAFVAESAADLRREYGNVTSMTVGAIQRGLLALEEQGGDRFFGEPALALEDLLTRAPDGRGTVHVLAADRLMLRPRLYSTFLLWLLAELFESLPEAGDLEQPRLVFFFDEAHLLFNDAPKPLTEKVEQVVRLIRSKGVGVYFITQHPLDVPDTVLGQLGNRVQHALRAFTPRDQKAVRTAAETFRPNPAFRTGEVITTLQVGEALVSVLGPDGAPTVVERTMVRPPESRLGAVTVEERQAALAASPFRGKYDQTLDRESAYELLMRRNQELPPPETVPAAAAYDSPIKVTRRAPAPGGGPAEAVPRRTAARRSDTPMDALLKSTLRAAGGQVGRQVVRGLLGQLFRGR